MIKDVSALLHELSNAEAKRLAEQDITHPGTIGAMYEGLAKDILGRALPLQLDLMIVDGFVTDGSGAMSGQIDCMLVAGMGDEIPYLQGSYKWHVKDVLAVFEVKKTLLGTDLADAYDQLNSVDKLYSNYVQAANSDESIDIRASLRIYSQITGKVAPSPDKWKDMPTDEHLILHTIMKDQLAPAKVVLGYGGYKTEMGLRKGILTFLKEKIGQEGYGVSSLPNLVSTNGNSLVKLSGHPYAAPLVEDEYWPILGSAHSNPIEIMLELIWTRLSYIVEMPELFGADLEIETFNPLLLAKSVDSDDRSGWMFKSTELTSAQLADGESFVDWEPAFLTPAQFVVIGQLCAGKTVSVSDPDFQEFLDSDGDSIQDFLRSIQQTHLVALDGDVLKLTTIKCMTFILPDGRYGAAENNTGRLTRWLETFHERSRDQL